MMDIEGFRKAIAKLPEMSPEKARRTVAQIRRSQDWTRMALAKMARRSGNQVGKQAVMVQDGSTIHFATANAGRRLEGQTINEELVWLDEPRPVPFRWPVSVVQAAAMGVGRGA